MYLNTTSSERWKCGSLKDHVLWTDHSFSVVVVITRRNNDLDPDSIHKTFHFCIRTGIDRILNQYMYFFYVIVST